MNQSNSSQIQYKTPQLLAPLPYLVLVSLATYVSRSRDRVDDHLARSRLLGVKAISISLLIAVLAADLVGQILSREDLEYETAAVYGLGLTLLIVYFVVLEWLSQKGNT